MKDLDQITDQQSSEINLYGITQALTNEVSMLLETGLLETGLLETGLLETGEDGNHVFVEQKLEKLLHDLHGADMADLLQLLSHKQRAQLFGFCVTWINPEVLTYLDEQVSEQLFAELDDQAIARFLGHLESDDAIELIARLDEQRQHQLLKVVPAHDRALFEQSLNFPPASAGRLMRREAATLPAFWTVGQAIDYMRDKGNLLPTHFYNLIVVGSSHKPVGIVPVSVLLRTSRQQPLARLFEEKLLKPIGAETNQEDVALLFKQYGLVEVPVVDLSHRLIGTITIDDIVDVMDEIHEEDLLKLGGVTEDDFYADIFLTLKRRFAWLFVNLLTAALASGVIGVFEIELQKVVALAILMPIVASMGGNAATQTMTVAVRALAVNELTSSNMLRIIRKEVLVGSLNGILFAICAAIGAFIWFEDGQISIIIALAMIVNLIVAAFAGIAIPLMLERMRVDPAIASSVLVTTLTDCVGFLGFLGFASLILF